MHVSIHRHSIETLATLRSIFLGFIAFLIALIPSLALISQSAQAADSSSITSISTAQGPDSGGTLLTIKFKDDPRTFTNVAAGEGFGLATTSAGDLYAWGNDTQGQIGNDNACFIELTDDQIKTAMAQYAGVASYDDLWAYYTSYFSNTYGYPEPITDLDTLAAGILNNDWGYGYTSLQELLDNVYLTPTLQAGFMQDGTWYTSMLRTVARQFMNIATDTDYCDTPQLVNGHGDMPRNAVITMVATNDQSNFVFAIDSQGNLYGWGVNGEGSLGDGTTTPRNSPVKLNASGPLAGKTITEIKTGSGHAMALTSDGNVYTWGSGTDGRLGTGGTNNELSPVNITNNGALNGRTIVALSAGDKMSTALDSTGHVYTWGSDFCSVLGNGATTGSVPLPQDISGIGALAGRTITHIEAGWLTTLAVDDSGNFIQFGTRTQGSCGNGSQNASPTANVMQWTPSIANLKDISLDTGATILLDQNGVLYASGSGYNYNFGNGMSNFVNTLIPIANGVGSELIGKTVSAVANTNGAMYAIDDAGVLYTWGNASNGELGNGQTTGYITVPKALVPPRSYIVTLDYNGSPVTCDNVVLIDNETLTCTTTAHIAGTVDVTLDSTSWWRSSATLSKGFTYISQHNETTSPVSAPNTGASPETSMPLSLALIPVGLVGILVLIRTILRKRQR